jgi:hypothetical protein
MEQFYRRFFNALPIRSVASDEAVHLLNPEELQLLRRTERWALLAAVLVELAAYLTIFLPIYAWPELFDGAILQLGGPFTHSDAEIPWLRNMWMLVVTVFELWVLLLLNLAAVHGVAVATGYIRRDDKASETSGLIRIALENQFYELQQFGINPYEKIPGWVLFIFLAFNRLKGLLGSVIARAILTNLFGREVLRVYLDFSGMPIYMLVNLYTTHVILRNARVVIMGQTSMEIVRRQLPSITLTPWEIGLVYDTLQYIAVNKRDYHPNHYYLVKAIIEHFAMPVETAHPLPLDYLEKLKTARPLVGDVCRLIIVLGFLLDGVLSWRERRHLAHLNQQGILHLDYAELENYRQAFVDGQGLDAITRHLLEAP